MNFFNITLITASIYFVGISAFASRTFASDMFNTEDIDEMTATVIMQNNIRENKPNVQNNSELDTTVELILIDHLSTFLDNRQFESVSAKDLQLYTNLSIPTQNLYNLSHINIKEIPYEITQQPNQPESPPPDKSQYNLFNPTPKKFLRSFNPGRPSKTDTPFTVDAGRVQIESDLVTYTRDVNNSDGIDTKTYQIFVPNIRVGLLNNVDFQIQLQTYNNARTKFKDGTEQVQSGYGDTTVGLRVNFWGNDGGNTALGMITTVKFPTNQDNLGNNAIEGGITLPFVIALSEQWNLGMETGFALNKNNNDSGYNVGFINSVVLGYQATEKLGTYIEFFTDFTTESNSELVATFDTGVTYLLTENLQLDAGVNIGLTQASDDFNPFVGFSVRF